jgi:glycolate oxidase
MDKTALEIVKDKVSFELPAEAEAFLLIELDGSKDSVASESRRLADFLEDCPGVLGLRTAQADTAEANMLWSARRVISPASFQLKPHKINEDVVVPRSLIPALVAFVEKLSQELELIIFTFGHAGDGNIHVNIMLDKEKREEAARGESAKKRLFEKVLSLGGTLSGEHGVGLTKSAYLSMELDEATLEVMLGLKKYFDPKNILNPGKIFA